MTKQKEAAVAFLQPVREVPVAPIFLTIPEVAEALRLDLSYVYKLVQAGHIPGVKKFGRAVRIHRETLEQWARDEVQRTARGELTAI